MTKGRDPGQMIRAEEATCPWDLNRMTQLISWAESLGFRPPLGRGSFSLPKPFCQWVPEVIESVQAEEWCSELLATRKLVGIWLCLESQLLIGEPHNCPATVGHSSY